MNREANLKMEVNEQVNLQTILELMWLKNLNQLNLYRLNLNESEKNSNLKYLFENK